MKTLSQLLVVAQNYQQLNLSLQMLLTKAAAENESANLPSMEDILSVNRFFNSISILGYHDQPEPYTKNMSLTDKVSHV